MRKFSRSGVHVSVTHKSSNARLRSRPNKSQNILKHLAQQRPHEVQCDWSELLGTSAKKCCCAFKICGQHSVKLGILSGANPSSPSRQRHEDRLACAKFPTDHALADACRTVDGPGRRAAKACRASARPLDPSPPSWYTAAGPIVHDAPKFLAIPRPEVCPRSQALGEQQVLREANPPSNIGKPAIGLGKAASTSRSMVAKQAGQSALGLSAIGLSALPQELVLEVLEDRGESSPFGGNWRVAESLEELELVDRRSP
eukprot:CAMPEP_0177442566 /NCGR_PEP_ID=MMETSP0369-20130122/5008_1 /TAXON_ID=447022 ORGANISM="Scrippsiella hangoei-like, Strain SHHI-4" /NCGR_SAMPLE_ID=MMETSP0369 /ASSEMBLY_ACC=CAM_ASM_000364 /LENGTH=256 /DNA_ID=CAMNT_0018914511 /DNA_START=180 /DNA_END=947 /DNA_ORIENTATION=-